MPTQNLFFVESLKSLFTDVQVKEVFPDSKFFVDCIPNRDPPAILSDYEQEKKKANFDIKAFVEKNFIFPVDASSAYDSANKPLKQHLEDLWIVLTRSPDASGGTLIPLPFPYIVPGGRFREIYYWDSYFTMLGLQVSKKVPVIQNMVDNFAHLIDTVGWIPNGNRTYYLGRSQPPFFSLMINILAEELGESILLKYQSQLEKEYGFWMNGEEDLVQTHQRIVKMPDGSVLNRYWDNNDTPRPESYIEDIQIAEKSNNKQTTYRHIRAAAESGWDFSSRWFKDGTSMETIQTTDLIPVDLNCLLLHLEKTLFQIHELNQNLVSAIDFKGKMERRGAAIQKYCWNENKGFYFDFNHLENKQSQQLTLAGSFPLFFQIASSLQSNRVAEILKEEFLKDGGLVTTNNLTGQQWDAPNGWAPLQWIVIQGLELYGHPELAKDIATKWINLNINVFQRTGKMMEKYNVLDIHLDAGGGEYPSQDGFGWTNGVLLKLMDKYYL